MGGEARGVSLLDDMVAFADGEDKDWDAVKFKPDRVGMSTYDVCIEDLKISNY